MSTKTTTKTKFNLNYRFSADLKEIPEDRKSMQAYVDFLWLELRRLKIPEPSPVRDANEPGVVRAAVKFLGEIGSYAKMIGDLKSAKEALEQSLALIERHQLGVIAWAIHTLRFGDVLRYEKDYLQAETAFRSVLELGERQPEIKQLNHFALQHLGKLFFDQGNLKGAEDFFNEALQIRQVQNIPELIVSTELALRVVRAKSSRRPSKY